MLNAVKAIKNAISSLVDFLDLIFDFVSNLIEGLLNLFEVLGLVVTVPTVFSGLIFPAIVTSMTIAITIGVLYKTVGR